MQYSDLEKISNLYIGSKFENILWNVNDVMIPFDPAWANIGVSVSGGADSALLAYMLCSIITQENLTTDVHVTTNIRCWKTRPWQETNSIDVYNYLQTKFPNINFHRHVNFIPPEMEYADKGPTMVDEYGKQVSGDNIELRAFAEFICHSYDIPVYYNAVTRNPKDVDFKGMPSRDIEETEENKHLKIMEHMGRLAIHPFRFVDKRWILKQYQEQNRTELFNITRSCEGEVEELDYTTYKNNQKVSVCGKCFWCKEREWALESVNKLSV